MRVLICGGGVNGAAIAYLQSRRGVKAIFIDRPRLACAASAICGLSIPADFPFATPGGYARAGSSNAWNLRLDSRLI